MEKKKEQSFEDQIKELEKIVKDLENGNVPLDEAIEKFNIAMKLSNSCNEKLKSAEESINKVLNKDGKLEDFEIKE